MSVSKDELGKYGEGSQDEMVEAFLVAPDPEDLVKPTSATPMIEVVAPATLSEGYKFNVSMPSGETMSVSVPLGGVESGQKFFVPMSSMPASSNSPRISIPVGHWRGSIVGCCKYGCYHSSFLVSWCCAPVAAGQVISRLKLDWLGRPTNGDVQKSTGAFKILFNLTLAYWVLRVFCTLGDFPLFKFLALLCFSIFSFYILRNIRSHVRQKYAIPEDRICPGCEDTCYSCLCPCLVASQLLHHTTDYNTYRGAFFTETGVPDHIDAVIV